MKYNQTSPKIAESNIAYINQRWGQLSELELAWYGDAIKFLFLVNSGAAATVLAFIGAVEGVRGLLWTWLMLLCFTIGIILVGLLHISRVLRVDRLYKNWRQSTVQYYESKLCWETMLENDDKLAYSFNWAYVWGYSAFGFFVTGVLIGALNFNLIAKGDTNGRQQTKQTVHTPAPPTGPAAKVDPGNSPGLDQKRPTDSGVRSTAPAADQKEIKTNPAGANQ